MMEVAVGGDKKQVELRDIKEGATLDKAGDASRC